MPTTTRSKPDRDKVQKEPVDCMYCGKSFVYRKRLENHVKSEHLKLLSAAASSSINGGSMTAGISARRSRARTQAAIAADNANAHNSPLLRLPTDILVLIMKSVDDFGTLRDLFLTAQRFSKLFRQFEKGICGAIARRIFPPEAIALLNYWRPGGLSTFSKQFIQFQPFASTMGRWIRPRQDNHLDRNTDIIGTGEIERLKYDAKLVANAVEDWEQLQLDRHGEASAAVQFVSPLRRWFDKPQPLIITQSARDRVRLAYYRIMLLSKYFHPVDASSLPEDGIWDINRRRFDYTMLKDMPLRDLVYLFYTVDSSEIQLIDLREEIELDYFFHDRCLDVEKVKDWDVYTEGLRDVKLKGIWDRYQDLVESLIGKVDEGGGYPDGFNMKCYEKQLIKTPNPDGKIVEVEILGMKHNHLGLRKEWEFIEFG